MAVYGDLLFLINFSMDFLCFYFTCLLLHKKLPTLRACIASALGGAYSVAVLFVSVNARLATAADIAFLVLMCLVVFAERGNTPLRFSGACLLYFFNSALLGGIMTALFSLFNKFELFARDLGAGEGIDTWLFAILALLASALTIGGGRVFRSSSHVKRATLEISTDKACVSLDALVDSGNLACEPVSGKSVVFASLGACKPVLSPELIAAIEKEKDTKNIPYAEGVRFVSSTGIGGKALLPALRFPEMYVISDRRHKQIDAYVAIVPDGTLSGCDAIISDSVLI